MKKFFSVLVVVTLLLTCLCTAFASDIAEGVLDSQGDYFQDDVASEEVSVLSDIGASKANERYLIGVSMSAFDEYHSQWYAACQATAEQLGCDIVYVAADNSVEQQITGVESLIQQGCDAILLRAIDAEGCVAVGEQVADAGIKLVLSSNNLNTDKYSLAIMSDQYVFAEQQAIYLNEQLEKNPDLKLNVGYIWGTTGMSQVEERYFGFVDNCVTGNDRVTLLDEQIGNWSAAEAMTIVENWIQRYGDEINCVVAMNDTMALGAVEAFKLAGRDLDEVWIVGLDGSEAGIESVLAGEMDCTAYKDVNLDAAIQIRMTVDLLNDPEKYADNKDYLLADNLFPLSLENYDEIMSLKVD